MSVTLRSRFTSRTYANLLLSVGSPGCCDTCALGGCWIKSEMGTPVEFWSTAEMEKVLCGLRVSQMARTYEDLEAITHLLEEKQNDLELAAKIGKNLLDKNNELERRLSDTERRLAASEDTVSQLQHNLSIKDSLLQIYSRDHVDESGDDGTTSSGWISPLNGIDPRSGNGAGNLSVSSVNFTQLNRKVRELEEENYILREERNRLTMTADQLDEHETALIRDCARQLVSANMHIRTLSDELAKKSDAFLNQQSEVTRLLTRGLDLESRVKQLAAENEMLVNRLKESQGNQQRVANELTSLRDKYDECLSLYNEARSEVRALRKRSRRAHLRSGYLSSPSTMTSYSTPPYLLCMDSNTVSCSTHAQGSDGSSSSLDTTTNGTANDRTGGTSLATDLARTAANDGANSNVDRLFRTMDQARHVREGCDAASRDKSAQPDYAHDDNVSSSGFVSGSEPSELVARSSGYQTGDNQTSTPRNQRPLSPLSARSWCGRDSLEEQLKRHSWLGCEPRKGSLPDEPTLSAVGTLYPRNSDENLLAESLLSSDPTVVYGQSYSRLPRRLQLIKPLDGSEVLQHWQRLATPSFTNALFEAPLPGVQSRAGVHAVSDAVRLERRLEASGPNGSSPALACSTNDKSSELSFSSKNYSRAPRPPISTRELALRFGLNSPSQLLGSTLRSRSVEHIQHFVRQANRLDFGPTQPKPRHSPPPLAQPEPCVTAQFSLSSLVSSLLPFSLASIGTQQQDESEPPPAGKEVTPEPIRIRPRSPPGHRGLLDVTGAGSDPPTLQRAATGGSGSLSPIVLPSSQPPPVPGHAFTRPVHTRTFHNPSLSGIMEESGCPPNQDITTTATNPAVSTQEAGT
ncbi:hypothetical protein CRM22_006227 [Opisthorchis felineus]|uniref:HAP1 N-terminal domain-containing protein n=1 Tax=Opisthorchis felineus TaxID=147828 RepID=A0A4S2LNS8_OPIFE|nr:hypothetical protein CRM22_006227 [Opisthorchis felineus]TGZ64746.1 hypothetical protein CRM22_006227 [Opisthorchis felineus]